MFQDEKGKLGVVRLEPVSSEKIQAVTQECIGMVKAQRDCPSDAWVIDHVVKYIAYNNLFHPEVILS